jgi:hypothetical protein
MRMFHVKRYNQQRSHSAGPTHTTIAKAPATDSSPTHGVPTSGGRPALRMMGVWLLRRNSPYGYERLEDLALSVAPLPAGTSLLQSMGSTSHFLGNRSCLPARLKRSGWRFYR